MDSRRDPEIMQALPHSLIELKAALNRMPGVGPRSAERMALYLVQSPDEVCSQLIESIRRAAASVKSCESCGALTESQPCLICSDPQRQQDLICIVVKGTDILSLEKSGAYKGLYHVLGGQLSPLNGVGPEDLKIHALEERLHELEVKEIILALGSNVEGDATSYYLAERLNQEGRRITKIAQGLPAGSDLDFADDLTIYRALQGRVALENEH